MSDSIFFRALAALETLCIGCLFLVPLYRASSHFWLFASVLLIGIGISVAFGRLRADWTFAWLGRPGVIRWLFRLVCAIPLLIFVLAVGVDAIFRNEQPCKDAVRMAEASDLVRKEIGAPLRIGWPIQGSSRLSGQSGDTTLLIPVSGDHGRATIRVVAKKAGGAWAITELTLTPLSGTGPQSLAMPITN
jgi:hypothetical protein